MQAELLALADRVEALEGPSDALDYQVGKAVGFDYQEELGGAMRLSGPRYTASLDAAMTLACDDSMATESLCDAIDRLGKSGWPEGEWVKQLPRYVVAASLRARAGRV